MYTPGVLKVKLKDCPGRMLPLFHTAVSLVDVWVVAPLFVHMTVEPTEMLTSCGWNTKSLIVTGWVNAGQVGVAVGVRVLVGVLVNVGVSIGVLVDVKVLVGVLVNVLVGVFVGVKVSVGVGVSVAVSVGV